MGSSLPAARAPGASRGTKRRGTKRKRRKKENAEGRCADRARTGARGSCREATGVGVLPVVGVLLVTVLDGIVNEGGDGLLAIVQMHEASDLALHVLLVAGILKGLSLGHGVVDLQENPM